MASTVSPYELASQGLFGDAARQIDQIFGLSRKDLYLKGQRLRLVL